MTRLWALGKGKFWRILGGGRVGQLGKGARLWGWRAWELGPVTQGWGGALCHGVLSAVSYSDR